APDAGAASDRLVRDQRGLKVVTYPDEDGVEFHLAHGGWIAAPARHGVAGSAPPERYPPQGGQQTEYAWGTPPGARRGPGEGGGGGAGRGPQAAGSGPRTARPPGAGGVGASRPPCASATERTIESPRPAPPRPVLPPRSKGSTSRAATAGSMTGPELTTSSTA